MDNQKSLIEIIDKYSDCLSDGFNRKDKLTHKPEGFVRIYEINNNKKELISEHNLVVYLGREWLLSRAFDFINSNIDPTPTEFISWLGLGNGGCPIGDPLNPTAPTILDTDLDNSIMINPTDSNYADYRSTPDIGYYKAPFDSITYEQDGDNYNRWLIARVDTTIGPGDANGFNISEAGLFTAASNSGGYAGPFNLYARVTFPTIVKTSARQLLFEWYVYF
jgi:hypothetical protein